MLAARLSWRRPAPHTRLKMKPNPPPPPPPPPVSLLITALPVMAWLPLRASCVHKTDKRAQPEEEKKKKKAKMWDQKRKYCWCCCSRGRPVGGYIFCPRTIQKMHSQQHFKKQKQNKHIKMTSLTSALSSIGHYGMDEEEAQVQGCRATPRDTETWSSHCTDPQ